LSNHYLLYNLTVTDALSFILENAFIEIEDGLIRNITDNKELIKADIPRYDLGGRLVLPGLLNPHHHLYSALATGLAPKGPTDTFQQILENLWWHLDKKLDEETVYFSALNGLMQSVKYGVTTIFDHHASMSFVSGSLEIIENAFRQLGLKGLLCYEISDRMGLDAVQEQIDENLNFFQSHQTDASVKGLLGMHANFTLSKATMQKIAKSRPSNLPIHIHCGEALSDYQFCLEDGFAGPVHRLHEFGLLDQQSLLIHCIHLSESDYELLENIKPIVVSNPESNANNNVGLMNLEKIPDYLLGTDGMTGNILGTMRSHFLLRNGNISNPLLILFARPSRLIQRYFPNAGKLAESFRADLNVTNYIPVTPLNLDNLFYHLVFGVQGKESYMTIADGKILYHNGVMTTINEMELNLAIRQAALRLHRSFYE
jgi:cytosine/adenosine deaminase-related metal-dependent hydrolase